MLDMKNSAFKCIKEAMSWDFSIKLINADDELQWSSCICIDGIRVIVMMSSLFKILVNDMDDIFNKCSNIIPKHYHFKPTVDTIKISFTLNY